MPLLRKAFMPGTKDPNGWSNGYVEPQATYQNTGSQTPIPHDRDGNPLEVEGKGMMKIPGYEWHDKSPQFHKLAGRVKDLLEDIGDAVSNLDPTFDTYDHFEELMAWAESENPPLSLMRDPIKASRNFLVWRKSNKTSSLTKKKFSKMPRNLSASDRSALIRLASRLPAGSPQRKAILAGLKISSGGVEDQQLRELAILMFGDSNPNTSEKPLRLFRSGKGVWELEGLYRQPSFVEPGEESDALDYGIPGISYETDPMKAYERILKHI